MRQAISALRAKASHAADDNGIMDSAGGMHITNADQYSIAFARTPAQVPRNAENQTLNTQRHTLSTRAATSGQPMNHLRAFWPGLEHLQLLEVGMQQLHPDAWAPAALNLSRVLGATVALDVHRTEHGHVAAKCLQAPEQPNDATLQMLKWSFCSLRSHTPLLQKEFGKQYICP